MEFGNVQRGILGVEGNALTGTMSKEFGVKDTEGFYINKVNKNSGAEKAGLKEGDIIKKLDNQKIGTFAELSGYINTKRPNDKINVTFVRDGNVKTVPVTLVKNDIIITEFKGLELENLSAADKKNFRIDYGVKIKEVNNDNLKRYQDELIGSVILNIDGAKTIDIESASQITNAIDNNQSVSVQLITKSKQVIRLIID
jgi:S1-C subfamily serine protease